MVENILRKTKNHETSDSLYRQAQSPHHHQPSLEDARFRLCSLTGNAYVSGMSIDINNCLFHCYHSFNLMSIWKINGTRLFNSPFL